VPFAYEAAPNELCLRQGELLRGVWLYSATTARELAEGAQVGFSAVKHELVVPLNADCDLYWDHHQRFVADEPANESHPRLVPFVFLCGAYTEPEIRGREGVNKDVWRKMTANQDERYHHFPAASIGNPPAGNLPELILDFKKTYCIPTSALYDGIGNGIARVAMIPPVYLHDLMQRFYSFHARVALPEL